MEIEPTPQGRFGQLPPEIRCMIWDFFYPRGEGRNKTEFAILRTSKAVHAEVIEHFDWPHSLGHFEIDIRPGEDSDSAIHMFNNSRSLCWSIPAKWFSDHRMPAGFEYLPVNQLDLVVNIFAPRGIEDPGEIISIWESCTIVRNVLNFSTPKTVKCLEIRLSDDEEEGCTWVGRSSENQKDSETVVSSFPARRYPYLHADDGDDFSSDNIKTALSPFFMLADVATGQIRIGHESARIAKAAGNLPALRDRIQKELDKILSPAIWKKATFYDRTCLHVLLMETVADLADGPAADHMRLKRFSDWCEEPLQYQARMVELLHTCKAAIDRLNLKRVVNVGVWARWGLMRLSDPVILDRYPMLWHICGAKVHKQVLPGLIRDFLFGPSASPQLWRETYQGGVPAFRDQWWASRKHWMFQLDQLFTQYPHVVEGTFMAELLALERS